MRYLKSFLKIFITDYKKIILYGDMHSDGDGGFYMPFIGKHIKIKVMGMFWIGYRTRYWK